MNEDFQLALSVIPVNSVFSTSIGSAINMVDEHGTNITLGKEVFTC